MKSHVIKLRQSNMLCSRCLLNVVQTLSQIQNIKSMDVNLDSKLIKITVKSNNINKNRIKKIVNDAIVLGKTINY